MAPGKHRIAVVAEVYAVDRHDPVVHPACGFRSMGKSLRHPARRRDANIRDGSSGCKLPKRPAWWRCRHRPGGRSEAALKSDGTSFTFVGTDASVRLVSRDCRGRRALPLRAARTAVFAALALHATAQKAGDDLKRQPSRLGTQPIFPRPIDGDVNHRGDAQVRCRRGHLHQVRSATHLRRRDDFDVRFEARSTGRRGPRPGGLHAGCDCSVCGDMSVNGVEERHGQRSGPPRRRHDHDTDVQPRHVGSDTDDAGVLNSWCLYITED